MGIFVLLSATGTFAQQPAKPLSAPATTTQTPPPVITTPIAPATVPALPAPPSSPTELRYAVVLDAAHGGTDLGAQLNASQDEKAYVLALSHRLHMLLNARSIPVILTRDADVLVSGDQRAQSMNHAHAAACLSVHATSVGNGVHLFTSSLPPGAAAGGQHSFVSWKTAQGGYVTQSLRLESELNTALSQAQIPVLMGRTTLMPLESATCPAVAIEIAPLNANTPVTDQKYQQQIIDALAAALTQWRTDWRMQP